MLHKHTEKCPKCGHEFSPTERLSKEIEKDVERRFQKKLEQAEADIKVRLSAFEKEKDALSKQKDSFDQLVENQVRKEKSALEAKLKDKLYKESSLEIQDLKSQLIERSKLLDEATKNELELRKKTRELQDKEKQLDLEIQRKMDAQRLSLEDETKRRVAEEYQLKLNEKDIKLESMTKTIEELKRKAHQGSQQAQGEAFEIEIAKVIMERFPTDHVTEIQKGKRGADVLHTVLTLDGKEAGRTLCEGKNTRAWSNEWITKAKEDQREAGSEFVIIISDVLPKNVRRFDLVDGVWVTDFASFPGLLLALRAQLIELHYTRTAALGKGEKLDFLYQYMTETRFRQRIDAIVEGFRMMKESLDKEKSAMNRIWSHREKCLDQVIANTSGMYGEVQAIIGSSLPKIPYLELEPSGLLGSGDGESE